MKPMPEFIGELIHILNGDPRDEVAFCMYDLKNVESIAEKLRNLGYEYTIEDTTITVKKKLNDD